MELWIRSQDKEKLCKVHDLCVRYVQDENNKINYVIQDIYTMGIYTTKERALEVLDEIQKLLHSQILCKKGKITDSFDNIIRDDDIFEIKELSNYVYEMPKE